MGARKDPYDVLGLPRGTPFAEVRAQYFRLARKHHPDKLRNVTDEERKEHEAIFKEITAAYDEIENGSPTTSGNENENGRDWRTVWERVETLFQQPELWDCMKRVLQGTLEDYASQKRKERLIHTMHMHITLEELHQCKTKKLQLLLAGVQQPIYVRVQCADYPCAKVQQEIDGEVHTIHIHMNIRPHAVYRFDDVLGTWDIYTKVEITWAEYLTGTTRNLPTLSGDNRVITIPTMPRMDVPIVLANEGVAGKGDVYIGVQWKMPQRECWEKLDDSDKNNLIRILNALSA